MIQSAPDYKNNDKLRALMLTRGFKCPRIAEFLDGLYVVGTVQKWHGRVKPMPDRAWELLQARMKEAGETV